MDFLEQAMAVADSQAPTVDRTKNIPWLKSFSFANGTFPIRIVSDEEKCPRGFHPYCVHEVQRKPLPNQKLSNEERKAYFNEILCTLSTHGTIQVTDEEGRVAGSKLAEPCAVCDVYADLQQTFGSYDNGKFMGIEETALNKGIQEAMEDMRQGTCLRYLFPCLVKANCQKNAEGFDEYVTGNQTFLAILGLQPAKYASDKNLLKLIMENLKARPDLFSRTKGSWMQYSRVKRNSTLIAEDASELDNMHLALLKKYPAVTSYGRGVEGIPGSKKTYSYDQAIASFDDNWWMKAIRRAHPKYSVDAIEPGLV